jgi:hypothetical protein
MKIEEILNLILVRGEDGGWKEYPYLRYYKTTKHNIITNKHKFKEVDCHTLVEGSQ